MSRSTKEWIGENADSRVPLRVRLRVWDRANGRCQCGCGWAIQSGGKWDCDHIVPLIAGGENREKNLQVILNSHHKEKTRKEIQEKSQVAVKRMKHLGIRKPRTITRWRRMDGTIVIAPRER